MRKPDQLRSWLLRSMPGLADQPDRLHMFIENGAIACLRGTTLSYEDRYELVLIVEDMARARHELIVPLLAWIAEHQPSLLDGEGISFEQDILDDTRADIELRLALTEPVIVTPRGDGGWDVSYPPDAEWPAGFDGPESRLRQLWLEAFGDKTLAAHHPDYPAGA